MAYSELIKNFNRIRDYMREFYVYGFKSRDEYTRKSARSYDNERRRIESWLGDYMQFRQTVDGKNVFLSIDSRLSHHNPLYTAWKAKSFTDGDITLHFILFDILSSPEVVLPLKEITDLIDDYLRGFRQPKLFDASTVRKRLNEYIAGGIIVSEKRGKTMYYRRAETGNIGRPDILNFFSEVSPCGVIGSYLLDREGAHDEHFAFKHHYITGAMDSEIVCLLFAAMSEKRQIALEIINRHQDRLTENHVIPLRIMISVQSGRQYLMAYTPRFKRITSFRIDNIVAVKPGDICARFDQLRRKLDGMLAYMWGVSTQSPAGSRLEHVEFTVRYDAQEDHIHKRLEREKRWLKAIFADPRIKLFTDEEIPWPEVEPLFQQEDILIFDQYSDGDPYTDADYIRNFRLVLAAVRNRVPLRIETTNHKGRLIQLVLMPEYIEYSEKDDKFRLIGSGSRYGGIINLGRIVNVKPYDKPYDKSSAWKRRPKSRTVELELVDDRNALERVLLHFAHFEKQAERLNDSRYKVTITYDQNDETEMVIRILSFGPMVKVTAPAHFVDLIKARLRNQKSCEH